MKKTIGSLMVLTWALVLLLACTVQAAANMPTLKFAVAEENSSRLENAFYVALKNIGYNLSISARVMASAQVSANSGENDGFLAQVAGAEATFPNLVIVPEPLETLSFEVVTSSDKQLAVKSWSDLSGLHVGTLYQSAFIDEHLPKDVKKVIKKNSAVELLTALANHEFDVAIVGVISSEEKFLPAGVQYLGPIDSAPIYAYLNKRNEGLVSALATEIKRMKTTGELATILQASTVSPSYAKQHYVHFTSYSYDSPCNIEFYKGLKSVLQINAVDIDTITLYSEFTINDRIRLSYIANMLRSEMLNKSPDAIIVSDEKALLFLEEYYFMLFPKVPVIFCGIQNLTPSKIDGFQQYFAGIGATLSVQDTVLQMIHMFPKTKKIFIINDETQAGIHAKNEIIRNVQAMDTPVQFSYNVSSDPQALSTEIKNLSTGTLILVGKYGEEKQQQQMQRNFFQSAKVPMFGLYSSSFGFGQVGGKYVDSFSQGKVVGDFLNKTINPNHAEPSRVIANADQYNVWRFDYRALKTFGINEAALPKDALIENTPPKPRRLSTSEKLIFGGFILVVSSSVLFLMWLSIGLRTKNRLLKETSLKLHTAEEMIAKDIEIDEVKTRLEKTLDSAPIGLLVCIDEEVVRFNKKASDTFDVKLGDSAISLYAQAEDKLYLTKRVEEQGYVYGDIFWLNMKKGGAHRFHNNISAVHLQEKTEQYVWLIDVEKLEQKKDLIAKSQEDMQKILNSVSIGLAIVGEDETMEFVNDSYIKMFAFGSYQEAIECDAGALCPLAQDNGPDSRTLYSQMICDARASDTTNIFDWRYVSKDDRTILTICHARGIMYHGKRAVVLVLRDVSEEKKKEELLYETAEAEKAANQLKNNFLVTMSHEIRTPMNAIVGLAEIERRKLKGKDVLDILKKISLSAKNLLNIIGDILDFSKIEAEEIVIHEEEVVLEEVIANALLMANQRIGSKNIRLLLNMDTNLPSKVRTDQTRLWQILKNILDNAAKYTQEGKIQLDVFHVESTVANSQNICFKVSDTGLGMSSDQMKKLFTPFQQFDNELSEQNVGTGLGMTITKQIVEMMNGTITVDSGLNEGTCFTIVLPFKVPLKHKSIHESLGELPLSKKNILVADDDPSTVDMMRNLLEYAGVQPVCVSSGEEAVRMYAQYLEKGTPFDIVILDYMMGGMNGIETALALKSFQDHIPAKLLMVSSYTKQLILSEIEKAGYDDVIEKPFTPSDFMKRVAEIVDVSIKLGDLQDTIFPDAKVLLCEDNFINQEVAIGVLEFFGITPVVANNGLECLALLEAQPFDLIFMDILMPKMDGHEATVTIRDSDKPYKNIPIVAMTANVTSEEIERCEMEGMHGHIGKPISFEKVYIKLSEWLHPYAMSKQQPTPKEPADATDALRKIEGLAFEEGLARFVGKKDRYILSLKKFATTISSYIMPIDEAMRPENAKQVDLNVHTLKGAAGNLGFTTLQQEAATYETTKTRQQYETLAKLADEKATALLAIITEMELSGDGRSK